QGRDDGELPATVLAMAQARLGRLDPQARRILRAASVFGEVFWTSAVAALVGDDVAVDEIGAWLEELAAEEVVAGRRESKFAGLDEFVFRHSLVRDAAYAMLPDADCARAHRLAAEWLEAHGETEAIALAEHFERGSEAARAIDWYRAAAEHALEGN